MTKHGIGKIVVWAFSIFLMLAAGVIVAIAFSLHFAGRRALRDIYRVQMTRAEELGLSVSQMAAGGLSPMTLVNISTAMHEIVEASADRNDNFRVDQMFLLDEKGKILAHSDITAVAKDSGVQYSGRDYSSAFFLPKQNPVRFSSLDHASPPREWYNQIVYRYFSKVYPELAASRLRVSVAVFLADGLTPVAALHIIISNRITGSLLAQTIHTTVRSLAVGLAIAFALTVLITTLFFVLPGGSGTQSGVAPDARAAAREAIGDQAIGQEDEDRRSADAEGTAAEEDEWLEITEDFEGEPEGPEDLLKDMDLIGDIEVVTDSAAYDTDRALRGAARIVDAIPLDPPSKRS